MQGKRVINNPFTTHTYLNARRRNHIAEAVVMVAEELGEIVQQHQQCLERALVQKPNRLGELRVAQEPANISKKTLVRKKFSSTKQKAFLKHRNGKS